MYFCKYINYYRKSGQKTKTYWGKKEERRKTTASEFKDGESCTLMKIYYKQNIIVKPSILWVQFKFKDMNVGRNQKADDNLSFYIQEINSNWIPGSKISIKVLIIGAGMFKMFPS